MQIFPVTVGPIVGSTTDSVVRIWSRGQFEKIQSGPRRCFGVARLWPADGNASSEHKYFKMNPNFDMTGIVIFNNLQQVTTIKLAGSFPI